MTITKRKNSVELCVLRGEKENTNQKLNYEQKRTLAENHPLRHYDTYGDSHYAGNHLVHRHDELKK